MSFPVGNVLSIQGILIVVGHVFGPLGVVVFSTARTISRSVFQALGLINNSVWPEISAAFGAGSLVLVRKLHRTSCQLAIVVCLGTTMLMAIFGDRVWGIWTLGKVHTDPLLLYILLLQMLLAVFWYTSAVVALAINKHEGIAKAILAASCVALLLAYFLMRLPFLGLRGAALALVVGDLITAAVVLRTSLRLIGDTPGEFFRSMFDFPRLLARRQ
jgi:O-antigen/teichoic acid export membrane protein